MNKKHRKGHITCGRNRYAREVENAWGRDWCYALFRITDGPVHDEIREDWWEQRADCRSTMAVKIKIAGIDGKPFISSERHSCIKKEDAMFTDVGNLRRPLVMPEYVPSSDSRLWHFAGGIAFPGDIIPKSGRAVFCEYSAKTRTGFVIVTAIKHDLPEIQCKVPQPLQDVRVLKNSEYDWLNNNW